MTLGNYFLKFSSGNRLQDLCNRLQALKFELKRSITAGNRLPSMCNRLHIVKFEYVVGCIIGNVIDLGEDWA